jgi:DNA-binding PadR family transcriptional regulator
MHTADVSVRLGLLALLDRADMYGYQLKAEYEACTGGVWPLNIGQVYSTLERLERDRLVATVEHPPEGNGGDDGRPTGGREQKYYAITRAGRDALAEWFEETQGDEPPPRDELLSKVLLALAGGREQALAVVTRQRTALTGALAVRRRRPRGQQRANAGSGAGGGPGGPSGPEGATDLASQLVTDALITRAEADLRWLDLCEARLVRHENDNGGPTAGRSTQRGDRR